MQITSQQKILGVRGSVLSYFHTHPWLNEREVLMQFVKAKPHMSLIIYGHLSYFLNLLRQKQKERPERQAVTLS